MVTTINSYQERVHLAQAAYQGNFLRYYEQIHRFQSHFLWKCSRKIMMELYENVSANHLEVGVGTGYFLDRCQFSVEQPRIALLDLNPNPLGVTAKRIERYQPTTHIANVLEPIPLEPNQFDSIGFNYVLHCLPGTLAIKAVASFQNLKVLMKDSAILFGSTILGPEDVKYNWLSDLAIRFYEKKGFVNNLNDTLADLEAALASNFSSYSVRVIGYTALFTARK